MSRQRVELFLPGSASPFRVVSQASAECMADEGSIEWRWHDPAGKGCRQATVCPYVPTPRSAGSLRGESCALSGASHGQQVAMTTESRITGMGRHGPIRRDVRVPLVDEHGAVVLEPRDSTLERYAGSRWLLAALKDTVLGELTPYVRSEIGRCGQ